MAPALTTTEAATSNPSKNPIVKKGRHAAFLSSQDLIDLEERHAAHSLQSLPVVLSRGQGTRLWDIDGKEYIDFLSAFSVTNQGHCHPRIVKVMMDQCQRLTICSRAFHNEWYPRLCEKVCKMLDLDLAFPMNSGSEAVDLAIKVSRKWGYNIKGIKPDEALVVTITNNYHGKSLGPLSASSNTFIRNGYGPYLPGVGASVDGRNMRFNNLEDLQFAFEQQGSRIAAVILECVQGYAGCLPVDDDYVRGVSDLCKRHQSLLVMDEIQSGLGRTGYLMAYQKHGVKPDMVILGKALTGGMYAMGMVVGTHEVMSQMQRGEHSGTFSGNPLACAVAIESLDVVLDERLAERSLVLGQKLREQLLAIKSPHTSLQVTGRGLFACIYLDESHPSGKVTASRLTALMRKRGLLSFSYANRLRLAPPLVISEAELDRAVAIIEGAIQDLVDVDDDLS
ncbi:aminotransferase class-III domain-containing protein [Sarocladium implicatum]|nr:aminotransferase class-III domain-containing protein [Sarocladium implicatum]